MHKIDDRLRDIAHSPAARVPALGPGKRTLTAGLGAPGIADPAAAHAPGAGGNAPGPMAGPHTLQRLFGGSSAGRSAGAPLDGGLRARLERAFEAPLGDVRVHDDDAARAAARAIGARAFALGPDIHLGGAAAGDERLLAHEAVHTLQQAGAAPAVQPQLEVSAPGDAAEREADRLAEAFVAGDTGLRVAERAPARIHRDPLRLDVPAFAPLPRSALPNGGVSTDLPNPSVPALAPPMQAGGAPSLGAETQLHANLPGSHLTRRYHHWTRGEALRHNAAHPGGPVAHTGAVRDVEEFIAPARPGDTGTHDGLPYTVFADEIRWGGADVWRNNSAGIMGNRWGGELRLGAIGIANRRGLAIFPTPATGEDAVARINLGHLDETLHHRIADPQTGYAPPGENNSEDYVAGLVRALNRQRDEDQARRRDQPRPEDRLDPLPPVFTPETTLRDLFPPSARRAGTFDPQAPYFHRFVRTIMGIEGMLAPRNEGVVYRRDAQPPPPAWVQSLLGMAP